MECKECKYKDEVLYKYNDELYCWDCLEYQLIKSQMLDTHTETYYHVDGEYAGSDDDMDEVREYITEYYDIEEVDNGNNL